LLSPADMLIVGVAALLFFGPDQLPRVAKRAGQAMREVQNTSQAFIREMERAADEAEHAAERNASPPSAAGAPAEPPIEPEPPVKADPATAPRDSYEI
jgi:sec-independent protein translocase protein TatA